MLQTVSFELNFCYAQSTTVVSGNKEFASEKFTLYYKVKDNCLFLQMSVELPLFPAIMFGEQYDFSDYVMHMTGSSR